MDTDDEVPAYRDPASIYCQLFVVCRYVWFDHRKPEDGFTLQKILAQIDLLENMSLPIRFDDAFVYMQLFGDPGDYRCKIRLVRIEISEDNEEVEIQIGRNGLPREYPLGARRPFEISELDFVSQHCAPLGPVYFRESGIYEFQLWAVAIDTESDTTESNYDLISSVRIAIRSYDNA